MDDGRLLMAANPCCRSLIPLPLIQAQRLLEAAFGEGGILSASVDAPAT